MAKKVSAASLDLSQMGKFLDLRKLLSVNKSQQTFKPDPNDHDEMKSSILDNFIELS